MPDVLWSRSMSTLIVGLTGGIGSGKSTVSGLLVDRGATLIDADAITRELQAPGGPVLAVIVAGDGSLDRKALAEVVFPDPDALAALNAIVHPEVGREITERLESARQGGGYTGTGGRALAPAPVSEIATSR